LCGARGCSRLTLVLLAGLGLQVLPAASIPEEPQAGGTLLLPGRLPWGATALASGEVLAPCEDQSLSVLDFRAAVQAQWRAPARFSAVLTASPPGTSQLVAAPLVTGRVEILAWDAQTRVLASQFSFSHHAETTATAWSAAGTLAAGWKDGHVELWSRTSGTKWTSELGSEVLWLLADEGQGLFAVCPDRVVLLDPKGVQAGEWPLGGRPRGVLQKVDGTLVLWTSTGLWQKSPLDAAFRQIDASQEIVGAVVDRQNKILLTEVHRVRRLEPSGGVLSSFALPYPATASSALDDRGRVLVATDHGVQMWTYDGRLLALLDSAAPASDVLITDRGLGVWSDSQWRVHIWTGFRLAALGWPEEGGNPGRTFQGHSPSRVSARVLDWSDDSQFGFLFDLIASGDEAKQSHVLDLLEAKAAAGNLLAAWPFANLLLLKLARSGITDLRLDHGRVTNSWPALRMRALFLLSRTAAPQDRDELVDLLHLEFDPSVAAQGARALARSGWDGDGKLMRQLNELLGRMSDQSTVADAVIDASRTLWEVNGRSTDPVLIALVSELYQGPYPRAIKLKAQKFFQDLVQAP